MGCSKVSLPKRKFTGKTEQGLPPFRLRDPDVLEWKYTGNCFHPTQKPVSVLTPLVESFLNPGDVVLDPFCGSGSTLLAARELNCCFLGIELSKQYFDLAEQRLR